MTDQNSTPSHTTISVGTETRDALYYQKEPGETYDEYLRRVLGIRGNDAKGGA